jgi:hypothetical protein
MASLKRKLGIVAMTATLVVVGILTLPALGDWLAPYGAETYRTYRGILVNRAAGIVGLAILVLCMAGAGIVAFWHRRRQRKLDEYIARTRK